LAALKSGSLHPPLEATGFMTTTAQHSGKKGHESVGTKVSCFRSVTLRCPETLGSRLCAIGGPYWTFKYPENAILLS